MKLVGTVTILVAASWFAALGCGSDILDTGSHGGGADGGRDVPADLAPGPDVPDDAGAPECERAEDCGVAAGPCAAWECQGSPGRCVAVDRPDGAACADEDDCTLDTTCTGGVCGGGTRLTCDDGNPCTIDLCSAAGACKNTPDDGASCDDGDACTVGDVCAAGVCQPGAPADCDDDNVCTDDACDPVRGCTYANNTGPCDDADPCTLGDVCASGGCTGTPDPCDDPDPCTIDSCDPLDGCQHAPDPACTLCTTAADCDDGIDCTVGTCGEDGVCHQDGAACPCRPGDDSACRDDNPCTQDVCTPAYACRHDPLPDGTACSDGEDCTAGDVCASGACEPGPWTCPEVDCDNRLDDDRDGLTDCDDPDCVTARVCGEVSCTNEIDDDADGATDCADSECAEALECLQQCTETGPAVCGQLVSGSTLPAEDDVTFYPDCSPARRDGGEYVFGLTLPVTTTLEARFLDEPPGGGLSLQVLAERCESAACVAEGDTAVQHTLLAGVTYYVVVDGPAAAGGNFTVVFDCGDAEFLCGDGYDNDFDGLADCDDPDCAADPLCDHELNCGDGVDDDEDGLTDCVDPDCEDDPACRPLTEDCDNGVDDDGDAFVDCFDFGDCGEDPACAVPCAAPLVSGCDRIVSGTTVGGTNTITWYPFCSPSPFAGAEVVYAVTPPANVQMRARFLGTPPSGLDLFLLGPDTCGAYDCLSRGDTQVSRELAAGRTYFVMVDGPVGAGAAFQLAIECGLSELYCADRVDNDGDGATDCADDDCAQAINCIESECADGLDDEGDGLVDCLDPDCWGSAACACIPTDTLVCDVTRSESTAGATNQMSRYTCEPLALFSGRERVFTYTADRTGTVRAVLQPGTGAPLDLLLLEGGCAPQNCSAWGDGAIAFDVVEGQSYHVVVDATEGFSGAFQLTLDCGGVPELDCADGVDDDGDGFIDCADPDCDGAAACQSFCAAGGVPLGCGQSVSLSNLTRPNVLSNYACEVWPETGGEVVFRLTPAIDDQITATLTMGPGIHDLDLLLLETDCDPDACLAAAADTLVTTVYGGNLYYLVVDGYLPADAGDFTLRLDCLRQDDVETDCASGADEDGDGLVDCSDPDCWWSPLCSGTTCFAGDFVGCGENLAGTTVGAPNDLVTYDGCAGELFMGGEAIYRFVAPETADVTVTLSSVVGLLQLQVLDGACGSDRCVGSSPTSVTFPAIAGRSYYFVVDALAGDGSFDLGVTCP
jgi:hypothetical protein